MFDDKFFLGILFLVSVVFFYAGANSSQSPENFFEFIVDFSTVLSSCATVIAVFLAYKAYKTWSIPITAPHRYESDKVGVSELKKLGFATISNLTTAAWELSIIEAKLHNLASVMDSDCRKPDEEHTKKLDALKNDAQIIASGLISSLSKTNNSFQLIIDEHLSHVFQPKFDQKDIIYKYRNELYNLTSGLAELAISLSHGKDIRQGDSIPFEKYHWDSSVYKRQEDLLDAVLISYSRKWGIEFSLPNN